jgi:hypothetical protein
MSVHTSGVEGAATRQIRCARAGDAAKVKIVRKAEHTNKPRLAD